MQALDAVGGRIDEAVAKDAVTQEEHDRVRRVLFEIRAQLAQAHAERLLTQIDHIDHRLQQLPYQTSGTTAPVPTRSTS